MKEKTENEMFSFSERVIKEVVKRDDEYTKQVIRDYLMHSPYVAKFRPGEAAEGGDGVSVVDIN